jgi:hypothetical protein
MNVHIKLNTFDIYDIDSRMQELAEVREWISELVSWNEKMFAITYRGSEQKIIVWFEKDEHATLCALRWS